MGRTAIIVGGGIIGIASAINLAEAGYAVTVVDRTGICEETSSGHAAAFAMSDIMPMAHKGLLKNVPFWLADPLGPLTIAPNYFLKIMPWLLRVAKESRAAKRDAAIAAQVSMMRLAASEMRALTARAGIDHMVRHDGSLELYNSEAAFRAALLGWAFREKHGVPFEHVRGGRLGELQPGLSAAVVAGTFSPSWKTVSDSKGFGKALWSYAERLGCRFLHGGAAVVRGHESGASVVLQDGMGLSGDLALICAGAWSHLLARQLGDVIPLETERGYNTTLPKSAFDAKRMLIFSADAFVLMQDRGQECTALEPAAIARSVLRRWRQLHLQLTGADPVMPLPYPELSRACDDLHSPRAVDASAAPIRRWSNRQDRAVTMPGLTGTVTISGPALSTLAPILAQAPLLHIGKQPNFGLGMVECEWMSG